LQSLKHNLAKGEAAFAWVLPERIDPYLFNPLGGRGGATFVQQCSAFIQVLHSGIPCGLIAIEVDGLRDALYAAYKSWCGRILSARGKVHPSAMAR